MKIFFIVLQYIMPQHALSRMAGFIADCEWHWLKDTIIKGFVNHYNVNMNEAQDENPESYRSFNEFFTRPLKDDARPLVDSEQSIACPADGAISQIGDIKNGRIFQAKGQDYSLLELLGGEQETAHLFIDGNFATIYLSPKDYHRVHMPLNGKLVSMTYVPGDLFSVNTTTAENVPRLFSRNERAICIFETSSGPMAVILVGAMIVAGIETPWEGQVAPLKRKINVTHYNKERRDIIIEKGKEMGRFKLGSTAIVLFGPNVMKWNENLQAGSPTQVGSLLGEEIPQQDIATD
jgi:phosphatidylserine decarboxylase